MIQDVKMEGGGELFKYEVNTQLEELAQRISQFQLQWRQKQNELEEGALTLPHTERVIKLKTLFLDSFHSLDHNDFNS